MRESTDERDAVDDFGDLLAASAASPARRHDPDRRRRRARARTAGIIVAAVVLLVVAGAGGYVAWALNAPLPAPVATTHEPAAPAPGAAVVVAMPQAGAAAVTVTGAEDYLGADGIRVSSGGDGVHSIASITKLITALVVLDRHPLSSADDPGPTITFGKAAHDLYDVYYVQGATVAAMPTGSSMSLHDALATMLIPSASNYAEAVANWAFGSPGGYRAAARAWLADHDLDDTTVVEATGIDPRNTSTTADLLRIADLAAADPTVAALCATASLTLPGPGPMYNTNDLLGIDGIDGLKTGNLGEGTFGLAYTADLDVGVGEPLAVTGAVLSGSSRDSVDAAVQALVGSIRSGFHQVPVASAGTVLGAFETAWGSWAQLVIASDASLLTWSDTPITVTMDASTPKTYTDGEQVGTLTWTAGPKTVSVPLTVKGDIEPPDEWWRLTHPTLLGGS